MLKPWIPHHSWNGAEDVGSGSDAQSRLLSMAIADAAGNGLLNITDQFLLLLLALLQMLLALLFLQCLQSWSSMAPSEELNLFFRCMFIMSLMVPMHVSYESYVLYALMTLVRERARATKYLYL